MVPQPGKSLANRLGEAHSEPLRLDCKQDKAKETVWEQEAESLPKGARTMIGLGRPNPIYSVQRG